MWVKQCNMRGKGVFGCSEIHLKWKVLKLDIKVNNAISIGILEYSIFWCLKRVHIVGCRILSVKCLHLFDEF